MTDARLRADIGKRAMALFKDFLDRTYPDIAERARQSVRLYHADIVTTTGAMTLLCDGDPVAVASLEDDEDFCERLQRFLVPPGCSPHADASST